MSVYAAWFHDLATRADKGVANNVDARALGRAAEQLNKYEAALRLIAEHRGKTLMEPWTGSSYSAGAHAAFLQLAGIAEETLGEWE